MRIEELVLEGFKSYPVRTQITGWDTSFNAITGLNGSGKSNILDAICFVLGLTDMTKLRCQNQQDLIYKRGAAGIVKASVTIVFDNSDKSKSPDGMHELRQITVTRQIALPNISKYLLNGHKSQQQSIHTLFQSVQLNINNPNFLIQQGRITKVLNMRPQEVLGLVEEAAGTRMFEDRKEKAIRTMSKKEKKVEEITSLLDEEITPKLDNLRAEKRSFLEYQKACTDIERLTRLLKAHQWTEIQKQIEAKEESLGAHADAMKALVKSKAQKEQEGKDAEKQKEGVEKRRDKEIEKGGKLKELEVAYETGEKEVARFAAQVEIRQGTITEEEKKVVEVEKARKEMESTLSAKRDQVAELSNSFAAFKESHTTAQQKLASNEELLQTLVTGLSNTASNSNNTAGGGYLAQIAQAKKRLQDAATEEESAKVRLGMLEKEFREKDAKRKEGEKESGEGEKMLKKVRKEVEDLRRGIEATGWSMEKDEDESRKMQGAQEDVKRLKEQLDTLRQQLSALDFPYSDPSPNFDRTKVKGLVVSLLSLAEAHYDKTTALELAAGAKLYNVVVQDEKVASQLLNNGKLKKRVTIIPLNKIQGSGPSAAKLARAQKIAPGKVDSAISLVGYPEEVSAAMAFVFGQTLICADNASASAVAFDKEVGLYSVSADGTAYDPSGTLSGGAAPSGSGILVKAQKIKEIERQLAERQAFLNGITTEEQGGRKAKRETWRRLVRELEIKEHEVTLLEQQVGGSNAAKIGAEVEALKKTITELKQIIQDAKAHQKEAAAECKKLEKDMNDFKDNKDSKLKELKATIAKQKSELSKNSAAFKQQQKEQQTGELELEQIEADIKKSFADVDEAKASVAALQEELESFQGEIAKYQAKHEKITAKLKKERATLTRFDEELAALDQVIKNTRQDIADIDLEKQKAEHEQKTSEGQLAGLVAQSKKMETKYPWILEEKQHFGKAGSAYNFNDRGVDIRKMAEKARELEESQKGMSKKVNPKVMNMIDSVEKKEAALKKMLSTVMKDKTKIEETIGELERHKRDALEKCFEKVTVDFGEIFGELLPGNFAKLVPSDGMDVTQGLDVKVRLGQVWKESLTELSGGQRSLIALSLIMALLQVKPAPMYILDEIDSALDLSHTQHIGQLFRSRFKGSQFIVVSLKEGLFTNANVLFKARFRDGTSIVERTAQRSGNAMYDPNRENDPEQARRARRERGP
ncbi:Structural maintenance of chromosomes protein 2 [Tulasnella sp. JGI-2019a]|nr:Structural maintenance of chromosomes protein 2 [Tulasnella sp. JGI-2019a]